MDSEKLPNDIWEKINYKHLRKIEESLQPLVGNMARIYAVHFLLLIGYERAWDFVNNKYGTLNKENVQKIFKVDEDISYVKFTLDKKRYVPVLNERLVGKLFGKSYKDETSLIKEYINGFEKQMISQKQHKKNAEEFIDNFYYIHKNFDKIVELHYEKQALFQKKIRLNIEEINKLAKVCRENRPYNKYSFLESYARFMDNGDLVLARASELKKFMDLQKFKKIPNTFVYNDGYFMHMMGPHDERIFTSGYKTHSCFAPMHNADNEGKDNGLLSYSIKSMYGGVLELINNQGKVLMIGPILRNGNVLMIHSIESINLTIEEKTVLEKMLHKWSERVIMESKFNHDDIDYVLITDLHPMIDFDSLSKSPYKFEVYDPFDEYEGMYTNFDKTEHYVLKANQNKNMKFGSIVSALYTYDDYNLLCGVFLPLNVIKIKDMKKLKEVLLKRSLEDNINYFQVYNDLVGTGLDKVYYDNSGNVLKREKNL